MNARPPRASTRPVILLTGASSGLGLALARKLLPGRFRLVLTARQESLPRFGEAGIGEAEFVHLRALNVCAAEERTALVAEATRRWGGVDILINNAGVSYRSVLEHWDAAAWHDIMETDVLGPCDLARLVLPGMRARHQGRIVNVSSVGGMMAMPTMSLYSAAKFALEGATESLWYEVRPWNIHVSLVEPGFINSDSFRNTRFTARSFRGAMAEDDPYHGQYQHLAAFIEKMMERARSTPDCVASRIVALLHRPAPPLRLYATPDAHAFAWLRRLLPRSWYHGLLYRCLPHVRAGNLPKTEVQPDPDPGRDEPSLSGSDLRR